MTVVLSIYVFFFKQKTAYERRISDWSSDVCSSDLFDDTIYQSVSDELDRTGYPEGFPALPEVPTARYTDKRMYDLEMEHLWRKTWLHACHISEIPNDG